MRHHYMKRITHISFLLLSLIITSFGYSQKSLKDVIAQPPSPQRLVNEYSTDNPLTASQIDALERKLVVFDDSTSTQITVVIVQSLDDMDPTDAATELGRSWGVGQKGRNNGVVLLIAKKEHKLSISPGYGLEGVLPDITCKSIIDDIIVPKFKENDYYRGIDEGTDAIMQAVKGEFTAPEGYHKSGGRGFSFGRIVGIIIFIIVLLSIFGGGSGGGRYMSRRGFTAWTIGNILSNIGSGSSGGGWSGGGGGSSGGFGGFGGGGFGGGGSSGSW